MRKLKPCSKSIRKKVESIFADPPLNEGDLKHRLAKIDADDLRYCLIDLLEAEEIKDVDRELFVEMMKLVGIGDQKDNLFHIAVDRNQSFLIRNVAILVLHDLEPDYIAKVVMSLLPDEITAMAELSLSNIFIYHHEPDFGKTIRSALMTPPSDEALWFEFFESVERVRLEMQVSALSTYAESLKSRKLAKLHKRMLEIISQESDAETVEFLEKLKKSARGYGFKREVSKALLHVRSNAISPDKNHSLEATGYAYLSSCDGQGAFVVLGCFENRNHTHTMVDLVIRLTADIRDGFIIPHLSTKELDKLIDEMAFESGLTLVKVPLAIAAKLVIAAEERTLKLGTTFPEDTKPGIKIFKSVLKVSNDTKVSDDAKIKNSQYMKATKSTKPTLRSARQLIQRPEYVKSWFFDRGDLSAAGVKALTGKFSKKWKTDAAAKLAASPIKARLLAMAEYMSLWHTFNNDVETAALCKSLHGGMKTNFKTSPLVQAMIEHSAPILLDYDDDFDDIDIDDIDLHHGTIGDIALRKVIKLRCFSNVSKPKGKDLALLDFTEAAHIALGDAFHELPGEIRPRESQWVDMAFAAAQVFLEHTIYKGSHSAKQYTNQLKKAITTVVNGLNAEALEDIILMVHESMASFGDQICLHCEHQCIDYPRKQMADVFFDDVHPATESLLMDIVNDDIFDEVLNREYAFSDREGRCTACDAYGPVDDQSMCEECSNKFERDMLRLREWNFSALAFGMNDKQREKLRKEIIKEFGNPMELIDGRASDSLSIPHHPKNTKKTTNKKKRSRSAKKRKK